LDSFAGHDLETAVPTCRAADGGGAVVGQDFEAARTVTGNINLAVMIMFI
jgi:hypothetical protein